MNQLIERSKIRVNIHAASSDLGFPVLPYGLPFFQFRKIISKLVRHGEDFTVVYHRKRCLHPANSKGAVAEPLCDVTFAERFEIRGGILAAGSDPELARPLSEDSAILSKWLCARPFQP